MMHTADTHLFIYVCQIVDYDPTVDALRSFARRQGFHSLAFIAQTLGFPLGYSYSDGLLGPWSPILAQELPHFSKGQINWSFSEKEDDYSDLKLPLRNLCKPPRCVSQDKWLIDFGHFSYLMSTKDLTVSQALALVNTDRETENHLRRQWFYFKLHK